MKNVMQIVKCGDYFQADDGPRRFGNICIVTKWIKTTQTSLILRCLEVNYVQVSKIFCVVHKDNNIEESYYVGRAYVTR